ncbi:hypothetical protein BDL97_17G079700 [Sphagnum fallax]|nr:hypothetical protein BDL97_17G079700 [Sphagnum fallax]
MRPRDQRPSAPAYPTHGTSQAAVDEGGVETGRIEELRLISASPAIGVATAAASYRDIDEELPSSSGHWAPNLLLECAMAVAANDTSQAQKLMSVLNELASPYGDCDQRLASYFLQALFCKITNTGLRCYRILLAAAEKSYTFESVRKMILEFQEASPWTTFGHVACNGAILEAFEGEMKVHVVDISSTFCTQWPTLLEALATRSEGSPNLRLSAIVISPEAEPAAMHVMQQIMTRLDRFARLMGVPFEYSLTQLPQLEQLEFAQGSALELREDEALAINCIHTLNQVMPAAATAEDVITSAAARVLTAAAGDNNAAAAAAHQYGSSSRDQILYTFRNANPKIVTIVEDEMELVSADFMTCFSEALRFYWLLFQSLDESFPRASNERLMLERAHARNIVNLLACEAADRRRWPQQGVDWARRLSAASFVHSAFSDDVVGDVRALLTRYKEGWGLITDENGLYLTWKDQPVICTSAWRLDL